mmetsp:Transcript_2880/g.10975  ORF Transcript_2880/g.10975 Transcript_2880/m.10975 type:complete len:520 (-) Transcript_2880:1417-2976(-)
MFSARGTTHNRTIWCVGRHSNPFWCCANTHHSSTLASRRTFSSGMVHRAYVPPSRRSAAKSTIAPKMSSSPDRAPKSLLDKVGAKHLGNFYKKDSTAQKLAQARQDTHHAMATLKDTKQKLAQTLDSLKNYDEYIATIRQKYNQYAWIAAVICAALTIVYLKRRRSKKKPNSFFYDSHNLLNDNPTYNDIRIARSDFLIDGRIGISSNAYIALIDTHNLFIYNNIPFTDQMAEWIPDTVDHIHVVVPNALHNFLLKSTVQTLREARPKAEVHIYLREGAVENETLKEWNKSIEDFAHNHDTAPSLHHTESSQQSSHTTKTVLLTDTVATTTPSVSETHASTPQSSESAPEDASIPPLFVEPPMFHIVKSVNDYPEVIRERFDVYPIEGMPDHDETLFLDRKHRVLLVCDLLSNVTKETFPKNKLHFSSLYAYYSLKGFTNKIMPFPPKAFQAIEENIDMDALIKSLNEITFLPNVQGIVMAHGEPVLPRDESGTVSDELIQWRSSWQERSPRLRFDEGE